MSAFEELGVCPEIIQAIEDDGWLLPTPVQAEGIPLILGGGDVCAAAETGSGKTGAFGLPCLQLVHESLRNVASTEFHKNGSKENSKTCYLDHNLKDAAIVIDNDGLGCGSENRQQWLGVRANTGVVTGKYMFEVIVLSQPPEGFVRVGFGLGVGTLEIGKDSNSIGYGITGKKCFNNKFDDYGGQYRYNDIVGCLVDKDSNSISFALNGKNLGVAYSLPPHMLSSPLRPAICGKYFRVRTNFDKMQYPMEGYKPIGLLSTIDSQNWNFSNKERRSPQCLILEPTRDLALQTYKCMQKFGRFLEAPEIKIGVLVGGWDEKEQLKLLSTGVDICVGTLLKTRDQIRQKKLDIGNLKFLVLDEADELIRNDIKNDIPWIQREARHGVSTRLQTLFFSATLHSKEVKDAISKLTTNATWIDLKGKITIPDTVDVIMYNIDPRQGLECESASSKKGLHPPLDGVHKNMALRINTPDYLSNDIKKLKHHVVVALADAFQMQTCMVFCRTNLDCDNLEEFLNTLGGGRKFQGKTETGKENPYSCVVVAGMRQQDERMKNLEHFKQGDVRFLICTDVAARGIDIQGLPYLIMMTLPDDPSTFFHRVGRVGRADRMGLAICLSATEKERVWYHKCPNRGKDCTNNRLITEGGCTIWYDEPECLQAIEEIVGKEIPRMHSKNFYVEGLLDPFGKLQDNKASNVRVRKHVNCTYENQNNDAKSKGKSVVYGAQRNDINMKSTLNYLQEIAPAMRDLKLLEREVQLQYLKMSNI